MSRFPRALALRCSAVLLALVTVRFVGSDLAALHRNAHDLGSRRTIVVARHLLELGRRIESDDVTTVVRYARQVPSSSLTTLTEVIGHVVIVPVVAEAPVLDANIAPSERSAFDVAIPYSKRALRVADVAGLDPPVGSSIDVIATLDPDAPGSAGAATVVAHGALVLRNDESSATNGSNVGSAAAANSGTTQFAVTLLVLESEARELAFAAANGVLTLALAPPENACCRDTTP